MILLDSNRIARTVKRIAYQIVEEARGTSVTLVGLNERGYAIAKKIQPVVEQATGNPVPLTQLDSDTDTPFSPIKNSQTVVIIDDVIFSGRTMYRAINKITEQSGFEKIYIAVLVDRGHRKIPVQASIVGIHVPTKFNEHVELHLTNSTPQEVLLTEK